MPVTTAGDTSCSKKLKTHFERRFTNHLPSLWSGWLAYFGLCDFRFKPWSNVCLFLLKCFLIFFSPSKEMTGKHFILHDRLLSLHFQFITIC